MTRAPGSTRSVVARTLRAVVHDGRSLADATPRLRDALVDPREQAFALACVYGVLRHYYSLSSALAGFMRKPLRAKDADVETLLLAGLYQLDRMQVPAHAVVDLSVEAARELGKSWACGLVNAILRRAIDRGLPTPGAADEVRYEHPAWLVDRLRSDWPQHWQAALAANNAQAPLVLRVNRARASREALLDALAAAGHAACATSWCADGVRLEQAVEVERLPGFAEGWFVVQDEAAQLAAGLLGTAGARLVLDACAAPGGKTSHLIGQADSGAEVVAVDDDAARMASTAANLQRLGLRCSLHTADAGEPSAWWDGRPFDRILLDAPCSATGVIRRHPDIRFHRRESDIDALAANQVRLLTALWPLLVPGGSLLYVTCSILNAENDAVVESAVADLDHLTIEPIVADWGHPTRHGRQILPGEHDMDGFYFCRLTRRPA